MSVRIKITAGGIYGANGAEVPIGTELTVKEEPTGWAGRYTVLGAESAEKTPVTNEPKGPFEARDKGQGWWAIYDADGAEVGKAMRKDDAEAFNAASDDDKAAFLAEQG